MSWFKSKWFIGVAGVASLTGCALMIRHGIMPMTMSFLFCLVGFLTLLKVLSK